MQCSPESVGVRRGRGSKPSRQGSSSPAPHIQSSQASAACRRRPSQPLTSRPHGSAACNFCRKEAPQSLMALPMPEGGVCGCETACCVRINGAWAGGGQAAGPIRASTSGAGAVTAAASGCCTFHQPGIEPKTTTAETAPETAPAPPTDQQHQGRLGDRRLSLLAGCIKAVVSLHGRSMHGSGPWQPVASHAALQQSQR